MWTRRIVAFVLFVGALTLAFSADRGAPLFKGSGFWAVFIAMWAGNWGFPYIFGTGWVPNDKSFRLIKGTDVVKWQRLQS